jgi:hypothetical protein
MYGWRTAFIAVGLLGVLLAPIFKWVTSGSRARRRGPRPAAARRLPVAPPKAPSFGLAVLATADLPKPSFWLLAFGAACSSVCGYGVAFWLPTFFHAQLRPEPDPDGPGTIPAVALFGGVAGIWLGGVIADRLGQEQGRLPLAPAVCLPDLPALLPAGHETSTRNGPAGLPDLPDPDRPEPGLAGPGGRRRPASGPGLDADHGLGPVPADQQPARPGRRLSLLRLDERPAGPDLGAESMRHAIYFGMGFYLLASALLFVASRTTQEGLGRLDPDLSNGPLIPGLIRSIA